MQMAVMSFINSTVTTNSTLVYFQSSSAIKRRGVSWLATLWHGGRAMVEPPLGALLATDFQLGIIDLSEVKEVTFI
jgi:hypothetical protein